MGLPMSSLRTNQALNIGDHIIKTHRCNLLSKLEIKSVVGLNQLAFSNHRISVFTLRIAAIR